MASSKEEPLANRLSEEYNLQNSILCRFAGLGKRWWRGGGSGVGESIGPNFKPKAPTFNALNLTFSSSGLLHKEAGEAEVNGKRLGSRIWPAHVVFRSWGEGLWRLWPRA